MRWPYRCQTSTGPVGAGELNLRFEGGFVKILFSSWPAYGHLLPMLPLARAAVRAGHQVIVSSGADMTDIIERRGFAAHRAGPTLDEAYAVVAAKTTEATGGPLLSALTPQQEMALSAKWFFGAAGVTRANDLAELFTEWQPDLVVHDVLEIGSPAVAEQRGVPHATHSYGPVVPGSAEFAAVFGDVLSEAGLPDAITAGFDLPYLDVCPPSLQPAGIAPWRHAMPIRPVAGEIAPGDDLPAGLAQLPHEKTVYLTLGTVMNRRPDVFRTVLEGCRHLPFNVVATTGPGVDPVELGRQPDNVLVRQYLPQALILPHCTAIISQAGAGTMLGALCHGLPQLCLPQGTDQPHNSAALVAAGAGLALAPDEITPSAVAGALRETLTNPSFRASARLIQQEINAMPDSAAALPDLVEQFRS
jgi:UDP:flavonoid glycosyltransferase YjiC (YdhE family)